MASPNINSLEESDEEAIEMTAGDVLKKLEKVCCTHFIHDDFIAFLE